jgi:hypothetical protein
VQTGYRTEEEGGKEIGSLDFGVMSSESEKDIEKDCIFSGDY